MGCLGSDVWSNTPSENLNPCNCDYEFYDIPLNSETYTITGEDNGKILRALGTITIRVPTFQDQTERPLVIIVPPPSPAILTILPVGGATVNNGLLAVQGRSRASHPAGAAIIPWPEIDAWGCS
jgi:hypothetical protein